MYQLLYDIWKKSKQHLGFDKERIWSTLYLVGAIAAACLQSISLFSFDASLGRLYMAIDSRNKTSQIITDTVIGAIVGGLATSIFSALGKFSTSKFQNHLFTSISKDMTNQWMRRSVGLNLNPGDIDPARAIAKDSEYYSSYAGVFVYNAMFNLPRLLFSAYKLYQMSAIYFSAVVATSAAMKVLYGVYYSIYKEHTQKEREDQTKLHDLARNIASNRRQIAWSNYEADAKLELLTHLENAQGKNTATSIKKAEITLVNEFSKILFAVIPAFFMRREILQNVASAIDITRMAAYSTMFLKALTLKERNYFSSVDLEQYKGKIDQTFKAFDKASQKNKKTRVLFNKDDKIKLKNINLTAEDGQRILQGVSCDFRQGKIYKIDGRNASGKTSLINVILGMNPDDRSDSHISYPAKYRKNKNYICCLSKPNYFPKDKTLLECITLSIKSEENDFKARRACQDKVVGLLELCGYNNLVDLLDTKRDWSNQLSQGEKAVVHIVNAVLRKPGFLILDETLDCIDLRNIDKVEGMLVNEIHNKGGSIIYISHREKFSGRSFELTGQAESEREVDSGDEEVVDRPAAVARVSSFDSDRIGTPPVIKFDNSKFGGKDITILKLKDGCIAEIDPRQVEVRLMSPTNVTRGSGGRQSTLFTGRIGPSSMVSPAIRPQAVHPVIEEELSSMLLGGSERVSVQATKSKKGSIQITV